MTVTLGKRGLILSSEESVWALHNSLKSWTLYNLSEAQISILVMTMTPAELKLVRICSKNGKAWESLDRTKYPQFFKTEETKIFLNANYYPLLDIRADSVTDTGYFVIQPNKVVQPRLHKRHEVAVNCVLVGANNEEFSTETIDLSEGGLYFKDTIPNWIAGYFLVTVKNQFQLMCSLVEDQKEKKRVQIVSEESDFNFIQYKNWLSQL